MNILAAKKQSCVFFSLIFTLVFTAAFFGSPQNAEAVAQWSRKYKTPCSTCHTVFPRLNYYGDRFMKNGYQDPDNEAPDGDRMKKRINEELVVDKVGNLLGFRLNVTPIEFEEKANTLGGEAKDRTTIGRPEWIQLFVAGSIFKNTSFFTEIQLDNSTGKTGGIHFSWWHLGFHNMMETTAINFTFGNVSPTDFSSHANRLRIFAPIKNAVYGTRNASGDDDFNITGYRPGFNYYGYKGLATWWLGASPGTSGADKNDQMNAWAGVKLEVTEDMESAFEGSSVSIWTISGNDAASTATTYYKSPNKRTQIAGNLRKDAIDVQAAYVFGEDDDWNLATAAKDKAEFDGIAVQAAYLTGKFYPAVSYDNVSYKKAAKYDSGVAGATDDVHKITPAVSYMYRENMRIGFYYTIDLNDQTGYTKKNGWQVNIRTMF